MNVKLLPLVLVAAFAGCAETGPRWGNLVRPLTPADSKAVEPAPSDPPEAVTVSFEVARGQLTMDPNSEPYRPGLPGVLRREGFATSMLARICVNDFGDVHSITVLRSADPLVDNDTVAKLRRWRYLPLRLEGKLVRFCYPLRIDLTHDSTSYPSVKTSPEPAPR